MIQLLLQNIYGSMENLIQINYLGKILNIFYDKMEEGLHKEFSSDMEIKTFIKNNINIAWKKSVVKRDNHYFLNIASVEDFGNFEFKGDPWSTQLLEKQLDIYKPLIRKFLCVN